MHQICGRAVNRKKILILNPSATPRSTFNRLGGVSTLSYSPRPRRCSVVRCSPPLCPGGVGSPRSGRGRARRRRPAGRPHPRTEQPAACEAATRWRCCSASGTAYPERQKVYGIESVRICKKKRSRPIKTQLRTLSYRYTMRTKKRQMIIMRQLLQGELSMTYTCPSAGRGNKPFRGENTSGSHLPPLLLITWDSIRAASGWP